MARKLVGKVGAWLPAVLSRFGTVALGLYLAWEAWGTLGPHKPEVSPTRARLADQLIPTVLEDLRLARQDVQSVALLHLENDPSDTLTHKLRAAIEQSGVFDLRDRTLGEKLRDTFRLRHPATG